MTDRRTFLKGTGVTLALPMLESIAAPASTAASSQRLVCIGAFLGFHRPAIYPEKTGADYETTSLLKPIEPHRDDFTVFSGLDHRAPNGHNNWENYLCGKQPRSWSFDQQVAAHIGNDSRFQSLQLSAGKASRMMNYTKEGVALPMIDRPSVLYKKLFASAEDKARSEYLLRSGRSALDQVMDEAGSLRRRISSKDQSKLDEYFDSVREVEKRVQKQIARIDEPVPETDYKLLDYDPIAPTLMLEAEEIMYDLIALALETDSTRVATMFLPGLGQVFTIDGETLQAGYHALSHHGNDPDKIRDLVRVELEHMRCFSAFLDQLKAKTDAEGRPLLDSTCVMLGTGMGDASRHSNRDLPTIVAGGGLKHGRHIAVDPNAKDAPLLGDLYLSLMERYGMETGEFSNASRNLNHLLG